jgi:outer membrane protein OmpA-like peptidoglycan-associated protein
MTTMRKGSTGFVLTAVVWLLAIGLGTMGSLKYKKWIINQRRQTRVAMQDLETRFKEQWQIALDTCADTPSVENYVARLQENKRPHQLIVPLLYRYELMETLKRTDTQLKKKHPRIKLAYDSFSGYCVFRSREFQAQLAAREIRLHLVDDGAEYNKRIDNLKSGEVPLAVFTVDALINTSAQFDIPPASIVMVLDESRGADAMLSYKDALPDLAALNRKDIKIVLTPDSPSETLARLVRFHFDLPELPRECFIEAKDPQEVYARCKNADPSEPLAFVLWEPFVSQLLHEKKNVHKLIDSANDKCKGYITDVLVVQKDYLKNHGKEVEGIVQAYLLALSAHQRAPDGMVILVQADSRGLAKAGQLPKELTLQEAESVVKGIHWKTAKDNYALLGVAGGMPGDPPPLDEMVKKITTVLVKTKAISRATPPALVDKAVCASLQKEQFDETRGTLVGTPPQPPDPDDWSKLRPLTSVKVEPLQYGSGKYAVTTDHAEALQKVVGLMKKKALSLEIHGCATGKSEADEQLAQDRAKAVFDYLRSTGGIEEKRLKMKKVIGADASKVGFVFFEAPE